MGHSTSHEELQNSHFKEAVGSQINKEESKTDRNAFNP